MLKFLALRQIIRYGVVGVLNNLLGYGIYLLVTFFWLEPKIAISILYPIGATTAYFGHSKYSFSYQESHTKAMFRYVFAHFIGYSVNFLMLLILSDKLKFPHQAVQASAIFIVAGVLFLMFRYFVFSQAKHGK